MEETTAILHGGCVFAINNHGLFFFSANEDKYFPWKVGVMGLYVLFSQATGAHASSGPGSLLHLIDYALQQAIFGKQCI